MSEHELRLAIPDGLWAWLEARVRGSGYKDAEEYLRDLIRRDAAGERARIDRALVEGLESGPCEVADDDWWDSLRREVRAKRSA